MEMRNKHNAPPPVLVSCRVVQYVIRDKTVRFKGPTNLYVGGKEVRGVPRLAIVRDDKKHEVLLLHCSRAWGIVGMQARRTIREAKRIAERAYPGISKKWVRTGITRGQATAFLKRLWKGQECSFCGRWPLDVQQMVAGRKARICNVCIEQFTVLMKKEEE
jgi:hypothetical protein